MFPSFGHFKKTVLYRRSKPIEDGPRRKIQKLELLSLPGQVHRMILVLLCFVFWEISNNVWPYSKAFQGLFFFLGFLSKSKIMDKDIY